MGKTPNYVQTEKHYDAKDSFYIYSQKILLLHRQPYKTRIQTKLKNFTTFKS